MYEFLLGNTHFIAAIIAFFSVFYVAGGIVENREISSRFKSVSNRREELRRRHRKTIEDRSSLRRDNKKEGFIQNIVNKFDLQKLAEDPNIQKKMMQAGVYGQQPVSIYYFCRIALPAIFAFVLWFYLKLINDFDLDSQMHSAVIFGGAIFGYYLPSLYLNALIRRRRHSIMRVFPDALDMLLVCVEAGTTVEQALSYVAEKVAVGSPELGAELMMTNAEMAYLPERRQAFQNLAMRNDHPGVRSVATALIQAERYGTSVGDTLRVMARENRQMRMLEMEKKAAALPAKMTLPMVIFFLPVLFLVILGPVAINFIENPPF